MDQAMQTVESAILDTDGVEFILTTVGTRGFGGVNRGESYVRLVNSDKRTFSVSRLFKGLLSGDPAAAFRGNFTQQEVMGVLREKLNGIGDLRVAVRNLTSLRQGANVDIDFFYHGSRFGQIIFLQ